MCKKYEENSLCAKIVKADVKFTVWLSSKSHCTDLFDAERYYGHTQRGHESCHIIEDYLRNLNNKGNMTVGLHVRSYWISQ